MNIKTVFLEKTLFELDDDTLNFETPLLTIMSIYWCSQGFTFQQSHNISTNEGIKKFYYWWLTHQKYNFVWQSKTMKGISKNIHNIIKDDRGVFTGFPTKLMRIIWEHRPDLQAVYPNIDSDDCKEYWKWWIGNICNETELETAIPIEVLDPTIPIEKKKQFLIDVIWSNREDLQITYPDPSDDTGFLNWWQNTGLKAYFTNIDHDRAYDIENHNIIKDDRGVFTGFPTKLMRIIWEHRPDLQAVYPNIDSDDCKEYWKWWIGNICNETELETAIPIEVLDPTIPIEKKKQFLIDVIWSNREDLQITYPDPSDDTGFLNWWQNTGLKAYFTNIDHSKIKSNVDKRIALIGHGNADIGLGEDARLIAAALRLNGYRVDEYFTQDNAQSTNSKIFHIDNYDYDYDLNIFCMPAFDMLALLMKYGIKLFSIPINFAIWQWELSNFPLQAKFAGTLVEKVFSISHYTAESIFKTIQKDVSVLPLPVVLQKFEEKQRDFFKLCPDKFLFIFVFDFNSFITRKNPLGVIESFQRAFKEQNDVGLVIKTMNVGSHFIWNEVKRRALTDTRIQILTETMTRNDVLALINTCDAVVSLHRAEGFGRLMAEALLLEKPVIASQYSGSNDYLNEHNAFLVDGIEVPIYEDEYFFYKNQYWFEPDLNHAAEMMKEVFINRSKAIDKAKQGKLELQQKYSLEHTGKILKDNINGVSDV